MLAQQASRVDSVDIGYAEACLKQEAERFKGVSAQSEGRLLAVRVFGSGFVPNADEQIEACPLFRESLLFKASERVEYSPSVVFAKPDRVVEAKSCQCGFVCLERFMINREGVLIEISKGRKLRVGPSTHSDFRLTLDEAAGFEKRGYIRKIG